MFTSKLRVVRAQANMTIPTTTTSSDAHVKACVHACDIWTMSKAQKVGSIQKLQVGRFSSFC
jgi:hypothetical protein